MFFPPDRISPAVCCNLELLNSGMSAIPLPGYSGTAAKSACGYNTPAGELPLTGKQNGSVTFIYVTIYTNFNFILTQMKGKVNHLGERIFLAISSRKSFSNLHKIYFPVLSNLTKVSPSSGPDGKHRKIRPYRMNGCQKQIRQYNSPLFANNSIVIWKMIAGAGNI